MIKIDLAGFHDLSISREWLETDGRGGYAASTLENRHTRKYHGFFVATLQKPAGRYVLLSKLEDSLINGQKEHFFTSHLYPGLIFPPEHTPLADFTFDHFPSFTYRIGALTIKKSLLLPAEKSVLLVRYDVDKCPRGGILRLKPLLAFRGYHELSNENGYLQNRLEMLTNGFSLSPYEGMPAIVFQTSRGSGFIPVGAWYKRFQYTEEINRGFAGEEDLFMPGIIDIPVERKCTVILSVSLDKSLKNSPALWQTETVRRGRERTIYKKHAAGLDEEDGILYLSLLQAGRQFLIKTPSGKSAIIAGYPWFDSWGRDTLISLPGLCFHAGRLPEGIEVLKEISLHEKDGLFPNFFTAAGTPDAYNTVDSSLWYFWTVQELLQATSDTELIRNHFWPVMKRIIRSFLAGTRFETGIDNSGLLHAGNPGTALTWMDAMVNNKPVTSRHGCPVEINALWYNALCFSRELAAQFGEPELVDPGFIPHLRTAFQETFWNREDNCLGDVWNDGILDRSIRPNQLFAVSLPFSPLDDEEQKAVVQAAREHLLTPFGLRTLSPSDPEYRGLYIGNPAERDSAYHQGTVWPWLLGAFGQAALTAAADKEQERKNLKKYLRAFLKKHLPEAGIGSISEVFDGNGPHNPGGCIAQAWSVAELTRLYSLLIRD
ncbi:MAG: amylo-alpha-1,6-glucosidase [Syntrophales bacterium]